MDHRVEHLFADEVDGQRPVEAKHRLGRAARQRRERRRLQLRDVRLVQVDHQTALENQTIRYVISHQGWQELAGARRCRGNNLPGAGAAAATTTSVAPQWAMAPRRPSRVTPPVPIRRRCGSPAYQVNQFTKEKNHYLTLLK